MTRPLSASIVRRLLCLSTSDATELARIISSILTGSNTQPRDVQVALVTIGQMKSDGLISRNEVEIVCTAPSRLGIPLRTTFSTILEMIGAANSDILVVGYVFTEGAHKVVKELAAAARVRKVRVVFIGNRMKQRVRLIGSLWTPGTPPPIVFSRECDPEDDMSALHAKLIICDGTNGLITSANLSHHGLHENIEIGARIKSPTTARLVEFFHAMIREKELQRIPLVQGTNW